MQDDAPGGKDNYATDRAAAEARLGVYPEAALNTRANRVFLGRAGRHLTTLTSDNSQSAGDQ